MLEYKEYKFTGKTKEEAIQQAIENLQELEENLVIKILEETKKTLFKQSKIEITVIEKRDIHKYIKDYLINLLKNMGFEPVVELKTKENIPTYTIFSNHDALLIGKSGNTLRSLSLITKEHIKKKFQTNLKFIIDINDYKQKNEMRLQRLAKQIAKDVKISKVAAKLDPMNSYERRIIHNTLTNNKYVTTLSEGEEPNRYVVITPKED